MIYRIGMVEDDKAEASAIMLSLNENSEQLSENSFKLYELEESPDLRERLFGEIRQDIIDNQVQCVIIDYKLDTLKEVLTGIEVVKYLHEEVPEFPVIILTNVPEKGKKNDNADPDKVYSKQTFMKPGDKETREMVYHIERNMERYANRRAELEIKLGQLLNQTAGDEDAGDEAYGELLNVERELSKYVPLDMNAVDKMYSMEEMDKALAALQEFKQLLD